MNQGKVQNWRKVSIYLSKTILWIIINEECTNTKICSAKYISSILIFPMSSSFGA